MACKLYSNKIESSKLRVWPSLERKLHSCKQPAYWAESTKAPQQGREAPQQGREALQGLGIQGHLSNC